MQVGWGRRVISPTTYTANYCSGACSFPLSQVKLSKPTDFVAVSIVLLSNIPRLKMSPFQGEKPTNHATVLSILKRKLGLELPEPCCVPR